MPLPAQLDIYKASAGSGKTFLLTIQYLRLLFEKPGNYRHILAVTFTNKATTEMKERILGELENLATGKQVIDGKENVYAAKLLEAMPGFSFEQLHQQAKKIYSAILHDYSRFAVTTIDSFVQRIIRSFAYEIGLDAGFKLQLNTDIVKEDLADRLFKLLDDDEQLRHWVADMAISKLEEGKNWNFRSDMVGLSGELFKEKFQEFDDAIKQIPNVHETFSVLRDKVFATTNEFEKQWDDYCSAGLKMISDAGLTFDDLPYKAAGFAGVFNKPVDAVVSKGFLKRALDVLEDSSKMYIKGMDALVKSIVQSIETPLHNHLSRLISFFNEGVVNYNTASAISRNLHTLRLMQVFSEQLSNYRSENNELLISDTHLLLRQLTRDTEASFIYEKIGNHFQHYLIDEFQDTSGFQWDNFRPLLENTLAEGNYSLLVGDVKQAIYRWRNGDWRLLLEKVQEQLSSFQIKDHTLQDNRRSAKPVIHFNNYLFNVAPHLLQQEMTAALNEAPLNVRQKLIENGYDKVIEEAYKNSYQFIPDTASENGQVQIRFIELKDDGGDKLQYDDIILPQLHETISELLGQGYRANDIAILTRKNDEARAMIEYLISAQQPGDSAKYDLLSADALLLENNDAISIIISAMQLLADKSKLALAQLRQRLCHYKKQDAGSYDIFIRKQEDENILPPEFYKHTGLLRQLPLPEMVSAIIRIFQLQENPSNAAYLLAFQDMIGEWSRYGEEGLLQFLRYWEEEKGKRSLPGGANTNAVEVLTIHKAKGLAFTVLLMPYLNWKIKPDSTKAIQLWVKTDTTEFNDVAVVPVRYSRTLEQSAFAYDYFEEYLLGVMDSLNMLYVATTRARNRVIGWAPKPTKTDTIDSIDKLLYKMVVEKIAGNNIIMPVYEGYDAATSIWTYGTKEQTIEQKKLTQANLMPPLIQTNWKEKLSIRYKSLQSEQQQALQLPRQQGVLFHEALSLLQHPSQLDLVLKQMVIKGLMTESQQTHTMEILKQVVEQPMLDGWKNNTMQRLSEREIITPGRQLRRPDLVLYKSNQTLVIDFKFGDDKKELPHHKQQVKEYVELLQQLSFVNVGGYVMYAMLGEVEKVEV